MPCKQNQSPLWTHTNTHTNTPPHTTTPKYQMQRYIYIYTEKKKKKYTHTHTLQNQNQNTLLASHGSLCAREGREREEEKKEKQIYIIKEINGASRKTPEKWRSTFYMSHSFSPHPHPMAKIWVSILFYVTYTTTTI